MEQGRPIKWDSPIVAWTVAVLVLVVVVGMKAVLGSAWNTVFAAFALLTLLSFCVEAYRRRDEPQRRSLSRFSLLGWAVVAAGTVTTAAGAEEVGLPVMLLGLGLFFGGDRLQKRRSQAAE